MLISRIESLIMEKGMQDALTRASAYVEAGSDAIMIHSRQKKPAEIFEFSKLFKKIPNGHPGETPPLPFGWRFGRLTTSLLVPLGIRTFRSEYHWIVSSYSFQGKLL